MRASSILRFGYKYYSPEKFRRAFGWTARYGLADALRQPLSAGDPRVAEAYKVAA